MGNLATEEDLEPSNIFLSLNGQYSLNRFRADMVGRCSYKGKVNATHLLAGLKKLALRSCTSFRSHT